MPNFFDAWHLDRNKVSKAMLNGFVGFPVLSQFNFLLDPLNSRVILVSPHKKPTEYDIQNWSSIHFEGHFIKNHYNSMSKKLIN